jgi:hypothetical protein
MMRRIHSDVTRGVLGRRGEDAEDAEEVATYCPECTEREFGES